MKFAIGLAGDVMHQQHTSHAFYRSFCGNLSADYNRLVDWAIRDGVEWLALATDNVLTGTLQVEPTTPVSLLKTSFQQEDGSYAEPIHASIFVIHKTVFNNPRFDERFEAYWMDFHMVFNQWWHLPFSTLPNDCGLTVQHPYHKPRERTLASHGPGQQLFYQLFKRQHGIDFENKPHINPWIISLKERHQLLH